MTAPLLEREPELHRLLALLEAAKGGRGGVGLIEGHAGIGKTRLLDELRARAEGARVLTARGAQLEADFPFGVALQLLEGAVAGATPGDRADLLAGAAAPAGALLAGAPPAAGDAEDRLFAIVHGLFWLVANLAQRRPVLLGVDDAQWVDAPSLRLLAYLAGRIEELPACLVVAARPDAGDPAATLLGAIRAAPGAVVLRPAPLTAAAVETLVQERQPGADASFCRTCAELTSGNPLLLVELMAEIDRRGLGPDRAALAGLVPERLPEAVASRLAALPPPARELARAVAVLGEDADLRHAAALAELDPGTAAGAAGRLAATGVLAAAGPSGGRLRFVHALVAVAVRDGLAAGDAARLHRRAAGILDAAGAAAERVAAHLVRAPAFGEPWAYRALLEAAERAERDGAPDSAVRWLGAAVDEAPARPDRAEALARLGRAELALGAPDGVRHLEEAAELEDRAPRRGALLLELGRAQTSAGRLEQAAATLERARAEAPAAAPLATEIDAAWVTVARHVPALRERALARTRDLLARPRPTTHGERMLLAAAANDAAFAAEPFARVRELAQRALDGGRLLEEDTAAGLSWTIAAAALGWADDFDAVEETARAALDDARRRGSIAGFATASYARAYAALHGGRVSEAAADTRQALDAHPDARWTLHPFACVQLAWAELERDDPDAADAAIRRCRPEERWAGAPVFMLILQARGRIALARGRPADALELLAAAGERATAAGMANPVVVPWRAPAVLACLLTGDHDRATALATEELELARRFGTPRAIGVALRSAGLAARGPRSVELLGEAVRALADSPALLERCAALVELGAAERRAGGRAAARATLRAGLELAERSGALALARRAGNELEAAGARPRRRALRGPGALTPGELRVATMAASGMTNREIAQALFVTMKAVQYHLGNAYRKLGVRGREELAAALDEQREP